jgi:polyketide biosynthesis enoyl-CoA hydratase PksI
MPQVLTLERLGEGVVQLTMHDREHKNGFSPQLVGELFEAFRSLAEWPDCRALVVTGYDSYFCSGGTQGALLSLQAGEGKFTDTTLYSLALECPIPVVSAMQGHGIGGGFVFGLFADCVVLSRESVYTTNFMKYGFTPGMGATYVLPKKLGFALAEEMLISARTYRGAELERRGVPFPVLPRAEVLAHAQQLAKEIADKPRVSLLTLKAHLVRDVRQELGATIAREVEMHDKTMHQAEVRDRIQRTFGR